MMNLLKACHKKCAGYFMTKINSNYYFFSLTNLPLKAAKLILVSEANSKI